MKHLRVHLARLISRIFLPLCPYGCRQPIDQCACTWLPRLPEETP